MTLNYTQTHSRSPQIGSQLPIRHVNLTHGSSRSALANVLVQVLTPFFIHWNYGSLSGTLGIHFAETTMLVAMAGILSQFDISLPHKGAPPPLVEFTTGITRYNDQLLRSKMELMGE